MTRVHYLHNRPHQARGRPLRVMPFGNNPVEKLSSRAQLHHQMHRVLVLIRPPQLNYVGLAREVVHDLHLAPHVLDVLAVCQLALGDGLAREPLPALLVGAEVGNAELAPAQLLAHAVRGPDVFHGPAQDGPNRGGLEHELP
ncbi:dephospho-CoA kinase family [Striga asiatica]|uniref:Dephospho-CoA kinase family n=1 Tax=Striga asiatica TaxID=4170 RepID=A0A5A7Q734_STRAF|nr:dephospho-CoA kinase family [Striga asiatica]